MENDSTFHIYCMGLSMSINTLWVSYPFVSWDETYFFFFLKKKFLATSRTRCNLCTKPRVDNFEAND